MLDHFGYKISLKDIQGQCISRQELEYITEICKEKDNILEVFKGVVNTFLYNFDTQLIHIGV
jgi:hypothetical protein